MFSFEYRGIKTIPWALLQILGFPFIMLLVFVPPLAFADAINASAWGMFFEGLAILILIAIWGLFCQLKFFPWLGELPLTEAVVSWCYNTREHLIANALELEERAARAKADEWCGYLDREFQDIQEYGPGGHLSWDEMQKRLNAYYKKELLEEIPLEKHPAYQSQIDHHYRIYLEDGNLGPFYNDSEINGVATSFPPNPLRLMKEEAERRSLRTSSSHSFAKPVTALGKNLTRRNAPPRDSAEGDG